MNYIVLFSPKAHRIIKKLPNDIGLNLGKQLKKLSINPRLGEKLSGQECCYRYRIGDYRVVYEIHDKKLIILVINFGHRKEIYRNR